MPKDADMATVLEGALNNATEGANEAYRNFQQKRILRPLFGEKIPKAERQANWERMRASPDMIQAEQAYQESRTKLPAHAPISRDLFETMAKLERERTKEQAEGPDGLGKEE